MKKNLKASNKIELIRAFIVSIENLNPIFYEKLDKIFKKIPNLKLLYHNIKFSGDYENYNNIMPYDRDKLLLLIQKCRHADDFQNITPNRKSSYLFKNKSIFNQEEMSSYTNYNHYTYQQYKSSVKYYEKKLKPHLNKNHEKEKILFITFKGLVLIKFL